MNYKNIVKKFINNLKIYFVFITLIIIFILFIIYAPFKVKNINVPKASHGYINLQNYNFNQHNIISLNGKWQFFWHKLISPEASSLTNKNIHYFSVPDVWNHYKINNKHLPGFGYGTYSLNIKLKNHDKVMGLRIPSILSAYKIWIDGSLYDSNGTVVTKAKNGNSLVCERVIFFKPTTNNVKILIQVSNFIFSTGGIWTGIEFGKSEDIINSARILSSYDMFVFGILIFTAFYHIILFLLRKKDLPSLFFGVICFVMALRALSGSSIFYAIFPNFSYLLKTRLEYLYFYIAVPIFAMYLHELYPKEIPNILIKVLITCSIVFSIMSILMPISFIDNAIIIFELITLLSSAFMLYLLGLAVYRKKENSLICLIGFIIYIVSVLADILNINAIQKLFNFNAGIKNYYISSSGFLLFVVLSQVYILAKKFLTAFINVENYNKKLQSIDKLRDDFLANTSHELRTPLNGIIGISESLIDGAAGPLSDKMMTNLSMITSSARRLSTMVNDILDFSKLKNNQIELNRKVVDLNQISTTVVSMFKPIIKNKKITIKNNTPSDIPNLFGDELRIYQILYHLISNGVKYTEEGEISICAHSHENNMICIVVSNSGIGISHDKLEDIFKSFEQLTNDISNNYPGSGISLSITKKLVELHGGKVWIESTPNMGTQFLFTLPSYNGQMISSNQSISPNSQIAPYITFSPNTLEYFDYNASGLGSITTSNCSEKPTARILIADDEPINQCILSNFLSFEHYSIAIASNGSDVLKMVEEADKNNELFDLVILDVMMPKISGFEVCSKLRESYSPINLPIILLTAKDINTNINAAYESGANDYLQKPFTKSELLSRVKLLLNLKEAINDAIEVAKKYELEKEVNKKIVENEKFKNDFFINISHELRTPLNLIFSTLQIFEMSLNNMDSPSFSTEKINKYSNIMKQNCYRMVRLVNNLIDITKIDAGFYEITLKNHNIVEIIEDVTMSVADYVENNSIKFVFDTNVEEKIIACDPDSLERIMLNLLSNAVKFTKKDGLIEVNLIDKNDKIIISVKDNGIGVPEDQLQLIFERFRQVDKSLKRSHEGSGIGLSIVKSLVELHSGKINIKSVYGNGTEFIIELPVRVISDGECDDDKIEQLTTNNIEQINIEFSDIYS